MTSEPSQTKITSLASAEMRRDLKASIGARSELGPDMEDHVVESFLAKIEQQIDARVRAEVSKAQPRAPATSANFAAVVVPSLALSIPLIAISAAMVGTLGVIAVVGAVLVINCLYFVYEVMAIRR